MAAGEYISMQSQRELFERQIELERAELEAMPDEEQRELAALYMAKGFSRAEADGIAERMFRDPETALDTLVREELGLDPDELGSPVGRGDRLVPRVRHRRRDPGDPVPRARTGRPRSWSASCLSLVALFLVGAGVSLLTGRGVLFSGFRQLAIGAGAAAVTFAVGTLIGVGVGGLGVATGRSRRAAAGRGPRRRVLVERPARSLRRPCPWLRQGAGVRVGFDPLRPARSRRCRRPRGRRSPGAARRHVARRGRSGRTA